MPPDGYSGGLYAGIANGEIPLNCSCCDSMGKGKARLTASRMRSATGGGKTKVATAVNWLSPLI